VAVLREAGVAVLSIDAGKTLIVDGSAMLDAANAAGITVVGRAVEERHG
jgi:DUF1009 family protein